MSAATSRQCRHHRDVRRLTDPAGGRCAAVFCSVSSSSSSTSTSTGTSQLHCTRRMPPPPGPGLHIGHRREALHPGTGHWTRAPAHPHGHRTRFTRTPPAAAHFHPPRSDILRRTPELFLPPHPFSGRSTARVVALPVFLLSFLFSFFSLSFLPPSFFRPSLLVVVAPRSLFPAATSVRAVPPRTARTVPSCSRPLVAAAQLTAQQQRSAPPSPLPPPRPPAGGRPPPRTWPGRVVPAWWAVAAAAPDSAARLKRAHRPRLLAW